MAKRTIGIEEERFNKIEGHIEKGNEEMGLVKEDVCVIKNDISHIKEDVIKIENRTWYIVTGIILSIGFTIAGILLR